MVGSQLVIQLSSQREAKINTSCHISVHAHRDNTSDSKCRSHAIATLPSLPAHRTSHRSLIAPTKQKITRGHHDTAPQPTPLQITTACPQHNTTHHKTPQWFCMPPEYQHWPAQCHGHPALQGTLDMRASSLLSTPKGHERKMSATSKSKN